MLRNAFFCAFCVLVKSSTKQVLLAPHSQASEVKSSTDLYLFLAFFISAVCYLRVLKVSVDFKVILDWILGLLKECNMGRLHLFDFISTGED